MNDPNYPLDKNSPTAPAFIPYSAGIAAVTCLLSGRTPFELNDTDENGKYIYIQDMHNIFDKYYIIYKDEDL